MCRVSTVDNPRDATPYLYLLVTMVLFGSAFTSSKVVVGQLPHDVAAMLRFGGGAVILVLLLCLRPGSARFSWRDLFLAGAVGLIGVFAYNFSSSGAFRWPRPSTAVSSCRC